jgi:hypothetical protein
MLFRTLVRSSAKWLVSTIIGLPLVPHLCRSFLVGIRNVWIDWVTAAILDVSPTVRWTAPGKSGEHQYGIHKSKISHEVWIIIQIISAQIAIQYTTQKIYYEVGDWSRRKDTKNKCMFMAQQKKKEKFVTDNSSEKHSRIITAKQNYIHDETEQIKFTKCQPPFNYEYLN